VKLRWIIYVEKLESLLNIVIVSRCSDRIDIDSLNTGKDPRFDMGICAIEGILPNDDEIENMTGVTIQISLRSVAI
jgi:hypothetical protein